MDILNYKNHPQWISIITSAILAVITTLIIVVFLPKKTEVNYSYDLGRPWTHGKLIAEFNFEIFKSPRAIEKERDSLLKSYQPYYQMDTLVVKKALADFERDVSNDTTTVMAKYSSILERRLHFLYEKGIMEDADYDKLILDSISAIHIVKDKFESQEEMAGIIPVRVAYNRLFDDEELKDHIDQLNNSHLLFYVRANLKDDTERNSIAKDELLKSVGTSIGKITKDQLIIDQGQLVDEEKAAQIESLKEELNKKNEAKGGKTRGVGQTIFVGIFILLFTCYLHIYRRRFFVKPPNIIMLYVLIAIFPICMSEMVQHSTVSIYILPFAMVPVITQVFFDSRTAFITLATSVFISAIAANYQYDFIIIEMAGGMAAIYALSDMSKRSELMIATVVATLCSALVYYGITLFTSKSYIPQQWGMYVYILISGVLLFLAYPLMYIIEKMFNFTSNITLFELSDTNQKLLRMLSEKAPGTFVHSTTVGNLAAEVARRIKANALLVRTGALYHDIGKMDNAVFFTENQVGVNPHDKLSEKDREKESARIIVSHVTNGLKLAENENLPDVITDFIRTHHGTGMAKYFYIQYKNKHPEEEVDPKPFSYPGPNPETREQAILMMADTVEAATKSLDFYSDEIISKKVNELIDALVKSGRFEECPITFRDIAIAKQVLADKLKSIYHTRITYPKLNEEENAEKIEDR
ncbi:MAG: HDIG domain-containing protein [Prevotella sp.]|nr:HDIG domain-containing protein [Prevotella sp.]